MRDPGGVAPSGVLPVRSTYAGAEILLTGASGFLAKVWLALLLDRVPEVGRLWILLRPKDGRSARERFEDLINHTPLFGPLHERLGPDFGARVRAKVRVLEGDICRPGLGLDPGTLATLRGQLDLVVHCAGDVDFNPDLRDAAATNIDGTLHVLELAQSCARARLVHVSTCFVAGGRQGRIAEVLEPEVAPNGAPFDPEAELADLRACLARFAARAEQPEARAAIEARVVQKARDRGWIDGDAAGVDALEPDLVAALRERCARRWLKEAAIEEGLARARRWGWRNIYTYTKALAEALVVKRAAALPVTVVRPAIVESSLAYPFPSWNDGLNTSAPIVYLLGTWFRFYPAQEQLAFDVIPVDLIASALTVIGAAALRGEHRPVYQLGSSDLNLFTMGRACELSALAHRRHLRQQGQGLLERVVKARWDAVPVHADHALRVERVARGVSWLADRLGALPPNLPGPLERWRDRLHAMARNSGYLLRQTRRLLDAYRPFIHDDHAIFECRAIAAHRPDDPSFVFDPRRIEWRRYWMETHVDGLRRWCWPLLEGREIERYEPEHPVRLPDTEPAPHHDGFAAARLPLGGDGEALA